MMAHMFRGCFVAIAVIVGLSASATPAMAQCYRDLSVFVDAAIGEYDGNGRAEVLGYASAVDNSSCIEGHAYNTEVCAVREGVPVYCGNSQSLYAEGSGMVDVGVALNVLARSTLFCMYFWDTFEAEDEMGGFQILPLPESETSQFIGWSTEPYRTRGEYRMTLNGGAGESFAGRQVVEEQLFAFDSCKNGQGPVSMFLQGG